MRDDRFHLLRRIAQLDERLRNGVIHNLDNAAAYQLLVLHERQIGLNAGRIAIHHETDGSGGSKHCHLSIAEPVLRSQLVSFDASILRLL